MEPDLWNGVIAAVPFVDVVSTMLDENGNKFKGKFDQGKMLGGILSDEYGNEFRC